MMMMISNLEEDLRIYCQSFDNDLYEQRIHKALVKMATEILFKLKVSKKELNDGIVNDLVSQGITKLPELFKPEKGGSCKVLCYIIMKQYFLECRRFNSKKKRDYTKTIFIEDLANNGHLIEIEVQKDDYELDDLLKSNKEILVNNKHLFEKLQDKYQKKISLKIIDAIEFPELYNENNNSFVKDIANKCRVEVNDVYSVIKQMREFVVDEL